MAVGRPTRHGQREASGVPRRVKVEHRRQKQLAFNFEDLEQAGGLNLLLTLDGKGGKQRVVPFSFELRRATFRYIADFQRKPDSLLLATRNETKLGRRVMLRAVKNLCDRLGFQFSPLSSSKGWGCYEARKKDNAAWAN